MPSPVSCVRMAEITFLKVRLSKKLIKLKVISVLLVEKLKERSFSHIF